MERDLASLANTMHDLLVIGGGIHGATAAWDAVLRGLSVALIDERDFGAATSANSLKTLHGGLRYLQRANFRRMRQSIGERSAFLRIAPHLVQPMAFLVPTYGWAGRGRPALGLAIRVADAVGFDRNRGLATDRRLPAGRVVPRDECLRIFPAFEREGLTGGAIWYDAQMSNSERLTLSFLLSAAERGACVANHVRARELILDGGRACGARVVDLLDGQSFEIRARLVLNAAGPWAERVLEAPGRATLSSPVSATALAVNLVCRGRLGDRAVGIRSRTPAHLDPVCGGYRYLFLTPWRQSTLVGTSYHPCEGQVGEPRAGERELQALVDECNASCPALGLSLEDVTFYHRGLVPLKEGVERGRAQALAEQSRTIDHEARDRVAGLISIMGVKYTTARLVAQQTIDLVFRKLGRGRVPCRTAEVPIYGGEQGGTAASSAGGVVGRLAASHGRRAEDLARRFGGQAGWTDRLCDGTDVLVGEVRHAVRDEMARKLGDVVFRRTDMGTEACPGREILDATARTMAEELGWNDERRSRELEDVLDVYRPLPVESQRR